MDNLDDLQPKTQPDPGLKGWLDYAAKDYNQAEKELLAALDANPRHLDTWYALGLTQKAKGDDKAAIQTFQTVIDYTKTLDDPVRANMVRRLAQGQINQISTGGWNLEDEIWHKIR